MTSTHARPLLLEFFNLRESPFTLTPATEFFYEGGERGAILEALLYAAQYTEGVITVTGEVGTGKTMLARTMIERKPKNLDVVYVANPSMSRDEIVEFIASELRVKTTDLRPSQVIQALYRKLIALYARGRRVVLLVDEAHVMSPQALEEIRLLSNLESDRHKLLRIVLVGQDELKATLATPQMRPLRERITERFPLGPLSAGEVATYLSHRLRRAGGDPQTFQPKAAAVLARASLGLSRRVNILAEKSMLAAFVAGSQTVTVSHVKQAIAEAEFRRLGSWRIRWAGTGLPGARVPARLAAVVGALRSALSQRLRRTPVPGTGRA